jgi:hypothetical protein
MYHCEGFANKFGITESENLWDKIRGFERLMQLVNKADRISQCMRSTNSYGEWRFITLWIDKEQLTLYGHGEHDYRAMIYGDTWFICNHNDYEQDYHSGANLNIYQVTEELMREHKHDYPKDLKSEFASDESDLFNEIADLTDDDGAISELDYL